MFSAVANNAGDYVCNATSPVSFYQSVMSTTALVLVQGNANVYMYICIIILETDLIIYNSKANVHIMT